jgi:membrane fusion protein (multidrug efflux system)
VGLRAEFPNPTGLLLPGEFVRAKLFVGEVKQGILVPQRAVTLSEQGGSVFVIDAKGLAALRPVKLGSLVDGNWIVESGLKAGDVVIVSNLQKLRPGVPVQAAGGTAEGKQPAAPKAARRTGTR